MNLLYIFIKLCLAFVTLYILLKTKYLDFIIDPSNKIYKSHLKWYINDKNQKNSNFIAKKVNKTIVKDEEQQTSVVKLASYKSVFFRFCCQILLVIFTILSFSFYFIYQKVNVEKLYSYSIIFIIFCFVIGWVYYLCYIFCDVYLFTSYIACFFCFVFSIMYGFMISSLYFVEYLFLEEKWNSLLKYFLLLFVLFPLFLTFIIVFWISILYKSGYIKVNNRFHKLLKILFIISFFIGNILFLNITLPIKNQLIILIFSLLESLFFIFLYGLVWVNTLNQVDLFIQKRIPKKCEWILVLFLVEAFVTIFIEILLIIIEIVNYLVKKR